MTDSRSRCLIVRPSARGQHSGGDEVVYGRTTAYLSQRFHVETLELIETSRAGKYLEVLRGNPPEATRYLNSANAER
jgi:hypothetical protein